MQEREQESRRSLINFDVATEDFTSAIFADSHGAHEECLGAGILYYGIVHMIEAQVAVCIGSGGGFVPGLMRRAQIDAKISPSATYLVDANLPDLGFGSPAQAGGWMTDDNPFREREGDVLVLPMLSVDAAKVFAAQGMRIDYLHIDGDHSKDGMLADFRAYAPLLTPWAVVTGHDLTLPGIEDAVQRINEEFPGWQMLGLSDIGTGTLMMRRRPADVNEARRAKQESMIEGRRKVRLDFELAASETEASQRRARFERWNYLKTTAYQSRYHLVMNAIDDADVALVELGGFPNSIVDFVRHARVVHAIEPYTTEAFEQRIDARSRASGIALYRHPSSLSAAAIDPASLGAYHLVALGLDLSGGEQGADAIDQALTRLIALIAGARRTALEIPRHKPSLIQWECIAEVLKPRVLLDVTLDLTNDPVGDLYFVKDDRAMRHVLIIEPSGPIDLDSAPVRAAITSAAERAFAVSGQSAVDAGPPDYTLGTPIVFPLGGNADPYLRGGWVPGEPRFRWALGKESVLALLLDEQALSAAETYEIEIDLEPFIVPGRLDVQRLGVVVNGTEVHREELTAGRRTLRFTVPRPVLAARDVVTILIAHPDARRPQDVIVGSKDLKALSFRFYQLVLRALPDAARPT